MDNKELKQLKSEIDNLIGDQYEEKIKDLDKLVKKKIDISARKLVEIENFEELKQTMEDLVLGVEQVRNKIKNFDFKKIVEFIEKSQQQIKKVKIVNPLVYPEEIKALNLEEVPRFPKEIEIQQPDWYKQFDEGSLLDRLREMAIETLAALRNIVFKSDLDKYQNPKEALAIQLVDEKGRFMDMRPKYITLGGEGEGGGALEIQDEGIVIDPTTLKLNFAGVDVMAVQDGTDKVTVYIPPLILAGYLDVVGITYTVDTDGYVSVPTGYAILPYVAGELADAYNITNPSGTTPARIRDFNIGATVLLKVNGVTRDTLTVDAGNVDNASITSPGGFITANNLNTNGLGQKERTLIVNIDFTWITPDSGATILVEHNTTIAGLKTYQVIRFYDSFATAPTCANPTIAELVPVNKWLSGVKYYGIGSTFNLGVTGTNTFNRLYIQNPLILTRTNFGASVLSVLYNLLGAGDPPAYDAGATYAGTLTIANLLFSENGQLSARFYDPWSSSASMSLVTPPYWLLNSYGNVSTDKIEYFRDSNYRLLTGAYDIIPPAITGLWDDMQSLATYDGGTGLQVRYGGLDYPEINYAVNYNPSGNPDYSALAGNRTYYRALRDTGVARSNLQPLRLTGISYADIQEGGGSQKYRIEIKLPTQSAWGNIGKYYSAPEDPMVDGWGALSSYSGSDFNITFHGKSTDASGWMIIVRITSLINTCPACSLLQAVGW